MSNPFAINPYQAYQAYQPVDMSGISSGRTSAGGNGSIYGNPEVSQPIGQPLGGQGVGQTGANQLQNELSYIGSLKNPTDFGNGLGGTNNPDDHKLFLVA